MAETYVSTNNSRGKEVKSASPTYVHIRGWDVGVWVEVNDDGTSFEIYATRGSNNPTRTLLGYLTLSGDPGDRISFELEEENVDRHDTVAI